MPDVRLKLEQVRRLCGIEQPLCKLALEAQLRRSSCALGSDGAYVLFGPQAPDPSAPIRGSRPEAPRWSQSISGISGARGRSTSLKGVDESSCLGTAHAPSRRRSGSLWPACFMLPRLASRGGTSRAVCC
jgi:hypothetical protein